MKRTLITLALIVAQTTSSFAQTELQKLWTDLVSVSITQHGETVEHIKRTCDQSGCRTTMPVIYNSVLLDIEFIELTGGKQFSLLCRSFPAELNCIDVDNGKKIVKRYRP